MAEEKDNVQMDVPPTSQVDLKGRLEADHRSAPTTLGPLDEKGKLRSDVNAPFAVEGNDTSAYVGVSPEYMTYAEDTHKPYPFDGVEGDSVDSMLQDQFAVGQDKPVESDRTLGSGSNVETVYTHTSGEDFVPEVVNREKVLKEAAKKQDEQTGTSDETSQERSSSQPKAASPKQTPAKNS